MPKRMLLIGYGSIGKRHARNLIGLGITPYILTGHPDGLPGAVFIDNIGKIKNKGIDHCIIASHTSRHLQDVKNCVNSLKDIKKILVEKPLECSYAKAKKIKDISKRHKIKIYTAYNMRFLEAFRDINEFVEKNKKTIKLVEVVAGCDLRRWRAWMDTTKTYSAHRQMGGGVDMDLSHEIDYVFGLFGSRFKDSILYRSRIGNITVNSPDVFKLYLDYGKFVVDISLDYIRPSKERYVKIFCDNGKSMCHDFTKDDMDDSYVRMLREFVGNSVNKSFGLCTMSEALDVLKVLEI